MKLTAIVLMLLSIAVTAYAWDSQSVSAPGPVDLPEMREAIYCQSTASDWNANNASVGFGSEMADDIPVAYAGTDVNEVTLYVAQWGAAWSNPAGMIVNFYNGVCPPGMAADASFTVPWAQCTAQLVYNGGWVVYSVLIPLPQSYTVGATTSIGGIVDQGWGQNPPYCGLVFSGPISGCGQGYWDGDFWGFPRWSPFSNYFGYQLDMAYCIGGGPVPTHDTTWGRVRSLYR
jgi:hypothetical protein